MGLKDWSIRKKLILSNMMMIVIPVVLILAIVGGTAFGILMIMPVSYTHLTLPTT